MKASAIVVALTASAWLADESLSQVRFDPIAGLGANGSGSGANAVSADGLTVVGGTDVAGCTHCSGTPFRWTESAGVVLLDMNVWGSPAFAVSANGSVIVGTMLSIHDGLPPCNYGFAWSGEFTWFEEFTDSFGVSDDGAVIVGGTSIASRWTPATGWVDLGRMPGTQNYGGVARGVTPDGRKIVGSAYSDLPQPSQRAFCWTEETGMRPVADLLPGATSDYATAISRDGHVIVGYSNVGSQNRAVRWVDANPEVLGELRGGRASAVSADGSVIVGTYNGSPSGTRAFIWDAQRGMRDLHAELTGEYGLNLTRWQLRTAAGVSADGRVIVGSGTESGRERGWRVSLGWSCSTDINHDGVLDSADFFAFLTRFFALNADFNTDGFTDSQDLFDFIAAFFAGC